MSSLSEEEITTFVASLDHNGDGCISYSEVEANLDQAYQELKPHDSRHRQEDAIGEEEKGSKEASSSNRRHQFIKSLMTTDEKAIPVEEFKKIVRNWNIPSLEQEQKRESEDDDYLHKLSFYRRTRAIWKVHGPEYIFAACVVALQLGLGIWQCLKYSLGQEYQAAFGWGVGLAKFSAGAIYPTIFFLLLSMSRWWTTFMRHFYYVSRFINWDHSQEMHIILSIELLVLATLHMIGHLSGTFNWGSRSDRQAAVGALLGADQVPRSYTDYLRSLPGWSGLTAIGLFYVISLMSMPVIRKKSYELFQSAHLLMFPLIGLLMAHGGLGLLQYPVLGFVLAFPTLLVIIERAWRIINGLFIPIPAKLDILDNETIRLTCQVPEKRIWVYEAGQYILLQVPQLSRFEWHPFTISTCIGREMQLHIKTDGDWTGRLRELKDLESVRIDGPFGAPAQRFYDYDQAVIIGAGIGITPFSGIINDLQTRENNRWSKGHRSLRRSSSIRSQLSRMSTPSLRSKSNLVEARARFAAREGKESTSSTAATEVQSHPSSSDATAAIDVPSEAQEESRGRKAKRSDEKKSESDLSRHPSILPDQTKIDLELYRRVDMHWIVRDKNHLQWFSDLLNRVSLERDPDCKHLEINLYNHLTRKQKDLSLHVYRCLLERHRTDQEPYSLLTGLVAPTSFGRPDFKAIFDQHYQDMIQLFKSDPNRRKKVGVFFCGAPVIGEQLADICHELTLRSAAERTGVRYHFQIEVFG